MSIGKNIKKIRKEKGITQKELAQMIGVSPPTLSQFESSDNLTQATISKIAKALNISPLILFSTGIEEAAVSSYFDNDILSDMNKDDRDLCLKLIPFGYRVTNYIVSNKSATFQFKKKSRYFSDLEYEIVFSREDLENELYNIEEDIFSQLEDYSTNKEIIKEEIDNRFSEGITDDDAYQEHLENNKASFEDNPDDPPF